MIVKSRLRYVHTVVGIAAMVLAVLALACWLAAPSFLDRSRHESDYVDRALTYIKEYGVTPELERMLVESRKPRSWLGTYITPRDSGITSSPYTYVPIEPYMVDGYWIIPEGYEPEILASDPVALREHGLAYYIQSQRLSVRDGITRYITGPDGERYEVHVLWSKRQKHPYTTLRQYAIYAALAAWVLTGIWITIDAKAREARPIVAWLWFGLIGGPVSLAVWLTTRPALDTRPQHCPGCGADTEKRALHCVRCGYALHPKCRVCHSPVKIDWEYCGQCGTHLEE